MPYDPNRNYVEEKPFPRLLRVLFIIVSILLFFISCFYICYCTTDRCRTSIEALLIGWLAIFDGGPGMAWIANPLLLITWILFSKRHRLALFFSIVTALISLSFLGYNKIIDNEGGTINSIIKIGPGYWLWLSSCLTTFLGVLTMLIYKFKYL
jgi:hypothetical protein